jgi:hypothetical protein
VALILYTQARLDGMSAETLRNLFAMAEMDAAGRNGYEPCYAGMGRADTVATAQESMRSILAAAHALALDEQR